MGSTTSVFGIGTGKDSHPNAALHHLSEPSL